MIKASTKSPGDHPWQNPVPLCDDHGPEIPADLLPGVFGQFAAALSASTETPPTLATLVTLGCLATACNGKFRIRVNPSWSEPTNIYVIVALPPGSRKSPVFSRCRRPLETWDKLQREQREPEIKRQRAERLNQEKLIDYHRANAVKSKDEAEQRLLFDKVNALTIALKAPDAMPCTFTTDATPEALTTKVCEQGDRFAVLSDEAGVVEVMSGLYSDGKANIDIYLKGWDGSAIRIERQDRSIECSPLLVLMLTIQPKVLAEFGKKKPLQGNGMMERILWAIPRSNLGERTNVPMPIPEDIEVGYSQCLTNILNCNEETQELRLSAGAAKELLAFRNATENLMRPSGKLREISGWAAKLPGQAVRIAGLLHIAKHGPRCPLEISTQTMEMALLIAALLQNHALTAFSLMSADTQDSAALRLFDYLPRLGTQKRSLTEIRGIVKNVNCLKGKQLTAALERLVEHGYIRDSVGKQSERGRAVTWYEVNPIALNLEYKEVQEQRAAQKEKSELVPEVPGVLEEPSEITALREGLWHGEF